MNRKKTGTVVAAAFLLLICLCACQGAETKQDPTQTVPEVQSRTEENPVRQEETQAAESQTPSGQSSPEVPEGKGETMIYAKIGDETLTIRPEENSSAEAFVALLQEGDLTVAMHDYGGFEKVGPLGTDLPTNDESITTEPGDVILYQGNQITIYYDTNTWRFTRLGRIKLPKSDGTTAEVDLVDDYGHHPAEMTATIAAARGAYPGRRLVLAFQPHRYTRTRDLFEDFVRVLSRADILLLGEVYAAGEQPIVAADGRTLARTIRLAGKVNPVFVEDINEMPKVLLNIVEDDDVVMTMGAGSITSVAGILKDKALDE